MSDTFDARRGLPVIQVKITGPTGTQTAQLALDTGSSAIMVNALLLVSIGYDPDASPDRVQITTASRIELSTRLRVSRIEALGVERVEFPVVAHTLPPTSTVDGLLGLDFFRGLVLTLDFREGRITLE